MQKPLDTRLADITATLTDFTLFSKWLTGGTKKIVFDNCPPSQAFHPGTLLIGVDPDINWDHELRLIYRDFLNREQQDWFRACLASELELINPHDKPDRAEAYVAFLLSMARNLKAREVTPDILLSLISRRFPKNQGVFDSALLAWCNLPTGIEQSGAFNQRFSSERLVDFAINDSLRYSPKKWMLHLFIGLARKVPIHLDEHMRRFSDDSSAALFSALSDRRKKETMFELERLANLGMVSWAYLSRTVPIQGLRTSLYPLEESAQQKLPLAVVFNFNVAKQNQQLIKNQQRDSPAGPATLVKIQQRKGGTR
jgi:hypothetical protein